MFIDQSSIQQLIGIPYVGGESSPEKGFDCWGLVQFIFRARGNPLPSTIDAAAKLFQRVKPPYLPGDVLIFGDPGTEITQRHLGIMLDAPRFVHCARATNGVAISFLSRDPWRRVLLYGVRYKCFSS